MEEAQDGIFDESIQDEDVDANASTILLMQFIGTDGGSFYVAQNAVTAVVSAVRVSGLEEVGVLKLTGCQRGQLVIVFAEHDEVHIIVPGDEPLVTDGSQKGAALHPAHQVVAFAHCDEFSCQVQLHGPHLLHFLGDGVPQSFFFVQVHAFIFAHKGRQFMVRENGLKC